MSADEADMIIAAGGMSARAPGMSAHGQGMSGWRVAMSTCRRFMIIPAVSLGAA